MVLVQRAVQLCSVHKTICAQIDIVHITMCAQNYWAHIDIFFLWMLTLHYKYDNYKCPHVPWNTHITYLKWKGWQMNCWTPVHNRRSAHCDTLQGKKVAERKYAALGIALSRPPGSELSLRFPFDKRISVCSSTLFLEQLFHFTFCLNWQEKWGLRLPPMILCYEAFLPSLPFVNLWWNSENENISFVDICACGLWLVRWL